MQIILTRRVIATMKNIWALLKGFVVLGIPCEPGNFAGQSDVGEAAVWNVCGGGNGAVLCIAHW